MFHAAALPALANQVFKMPFINSRVGKFCIAHRGRADGFVLDAVDALARLESALVVLAFVGAHAGPLGGREDSVERLGVRFVANAIQVVRFAARQSLGNRVKRSRQGLSA